MQINIQTKRITDDLFHLDEKKLISLQKDKEPAAFHEIEIPNHKNIILLPKDEENQEEVIRNALKINDQDISYFVDGRNPKMDGDLIKCNPSIFSLWAEEEVVERMLSWGLYSTPNYIHAVAVNCLLSSNYFSQIEGMITKYETEEIDEDEDETFINLMSIIQMPYESISDHIMMSYIIENQKLGYNRLINFIRSGSSVFQPDKIMKTFSDSSYYISDSYMEYKDLSNIFESYSKERKIVESNKKKPHATGTQNHVIRKKYTKEYDIENTIFDDSYLNDYGFDDVALINSCSQDSLNVTIIRDASLHSITNVATDYFPENNNIYKGKVLEVCASEKFFYVLCDETYVGALHFDEAISSEVYDENVDEEEQPCNIAEECIDVGDELLVQAHEDKELSQNGKNTFLTMFLTLIGLYVIILPNNSRMRGISQDIVPIHRMIAREKLQKLLIPGSFGFIIRAAGAIAPIENIQQEINDLLAEWDFVRFTTQHLPSPSLVYKQRNALPYVLLDLLRNNLKEVVVDNLTLYGLLLEYLQKRNPEYLDKISLCNMEDSIENILGIDTEILDLESRNVNLSSGGSLTFDYCESVTFIDVNGSKSEESPSIMAEHYEEDFIEELHPAKDGRSNPLVQCRSFYKRKSPNIIEYFSLSQEEKDRNVSEEDQYMEVCFAINMEAAGEIARQIKLRDLGGIIVLDFVEVYGNDFMFAIENRFRDSIECDKTRVHVGSMSRFGLIEVIRQKTSRQERDIFKGNCKFCYGTGRLPDLEFVIDLVLKSVQNLLENEYAPVVTIYVSPTISTYMLEKRSNIVRNMEVCFECEFNIICDGNLKYFQYCIQIHSALTKRVPTI